METKICKSCKRRINFFSRIISQICTNCGADIHSSCTNEGLEYESFTQKIIKHYHGWCRECAETNSKRFKEQRYCSCKADITMSKHQANCYVCGAIGHTDCFQKNTLKFANTLGEIFHAYDFGITAPLCLTCANKLHQDYTNTKALYKTWIDGTKQEWIKGYNIRQQKEILKFDRESFDSPLQLEMLFKYQALHCGANAYIKFHWERHSTRIGYRRIDGYGSKGNPHYVTDYKTEIWYTGSAIAVLVEPVNQTKKARRDETIPAIESTNFIIN